MEGEAFMNDFFAQVSHWCLLISHLPKQKHVLITDLCLCVPQAEDIRLSIDKIDESVTEIKKLYSTILSAPTSDQSNCSWLKCTHSNFSASALPDGLNVDAALAPSETQDDVEAVTNEIKKSANNARNKLKSQ